MSVVLKVPQSRLNTPMMCMKRLPPNLAHKRLTRASVPSDQGPRTFRRPCPGRDLHQTGGVEDLAGAVVPANKLLVAQLPECLVGVHDRQAQGVGDVLLR